MSSTALRVGDLPVRELSVLAKRMPAVYKLLCEVLCYQYTLASAELRADAIKADLEFDSEEALQQAATIDPSKLPEAAAAVLVAAFGAGSFRIDHYPLVVEDYKTYKPIADSPLPKNEIIPGYRILFTDLYSRPYVVVTQERIDLLAAAAPSKGQKREREGDDEYVTVKIKTGKGGWEHFQCLAKDAKDMQGERA